MLLVFLIVDKVLKRKRQLAATKTTSTQTSASDMDAEKALARLTEEMVVLN